VSEKLKHLGVLPKPKPGAFDELLRLIITNPAVFDDSKTRDNIVLRGEIRKLANSLRNQHGLAN
jgi:hypothetical protein